MATFHKVAAFLALVAVLCLVSQLASASSNARYNRLKRRLRNSRKHEAVIRMKPALARHPRHVQVHHGEAEAASEAGAEAAPSSPYYSIPSKYSEHPIVIDTSDGPSAAEKPSPAAASAEASSEGASEAALDAEEEENDSKLASSAEELSSIEHASYISPEELKQIIETAKTVITSVESIDAHLTAQAEAHPVVLKFLDSISESVDAITKTVENQASTLQHGADTLGALTKAVDAARNDIHKAVKTHHESVNAKLAVDHEKTAKEAIDNVVSHATRAIKDIKGLAHNGEGEAAAAPEADLAALAAKDGAEAAAADAAAEATKEAAEDAEKLATEPTEASSDAPAAQSGEATGDKVADDSLADSTRFTSSIDSLESLLQDERAAIAEQKQLQKLEV